MDRFDKLAHAENLTYFAYPTAEWVEGKYKSGFLAWVSEQQEDLARRIAKSLDVLVDSESL